MRSRLVIPALVAVAALAGAIGPAQSAFPGDNGKIVFTSDRHGGEAELYTIDSANAVARLTTSGPGANPVESPAWSPDGNRIAFARDGGIFSFDTGDSSVSPVTDPNMGPFDFGEPAWSPDGTMLAVTRGAAGVQGIWRVKPDGSDLIRLTSREDRDPAWSPDGGTIAFTRAGVAFGEVGSAAGEDIYLMNPDGSGQVRLTLSGGATDPAWSPDGSEIAFVDRFNEQTDISVLNVDDPQAGLRQVTSTSDREFHPAWSPDGTKIVYERGSIGGQGNELFQANADGSGGETPRTNGASDRWPDWQPLPAPAGADATCTIANTRVDEGNSGSADASFEVDCDNPTSDTYSAAYATADGTAREPDDYTSASGSFDVPLGKSHRQIHVNVAGESTPEPHETFTITLSSGPVTIQRPTATATIVDDDGFSVTVATESVPEGDSGSTDVELGISLSAAATQPVPVALVVRSQSAFPGQDYEPPSTVLTFDPGEVDKVVTIRVLGDVEFEGDQKVEILPVSRLVRDANSVDGGLWIRDDDEPTLSIDDVAVPERDSGTDPATFTVTRSHVGGAVAFDFVTEDASATAGDDYAAASGHISFEADSPTATVEVPVHGDVLDEPDETFRVRLSNPSNATIARDIAVGTIVDDDSEPTLSIDGVSVFEGDAGTTTASFDVSLSEPSSRTVTVDYATADGTAAAPDDYTAIATREVTFVPGGPTTQTVDVTVHGDTLAEGDEAFTVILTDAENASVSDDAATGTILDDDSQPLLSIDDVSVFEGDAGTTMARFTVRLSGAPTAQTVTVDYATADGTATAPDDYTTIPPTRLTFAPGTTTQTFDVAVEGDTVPEPDEFFAVELSAAQNAGIRDGRAIGRVLQDDSGADRFADATPLGTGREFFDTSFATVEAGEPGLVGGTPAAYPSVWFAITVGRGALELHAESRTFPFGSSAGPLQVSVYRGFSLNSLTLVTRAATPSFPNQVAPGSRTVDLALLTEQSSIGLETYYVQVVGAAASTLSMPEGTSGTLTHAFHPAPANDDFERAAHLQEGPLDFDTSFATVEPGEPGLVSHVRRPSVWFRLQSDGAVLHLESNHAFVGGHQLSVYSGSSLGTLALVKRATTPGFPFSPPGASIDMALPAGSYYVQLVGPEVCGECMGFPGSGVPASGAPLSFTPGVGAGTISVERHLAPQGDNRASPLSPSSSVSFDTSFATIEPDEPGQVALPQSRLPSIWVALPSLGDGGLALHALGDQQPDGGRAAVQLSVYELSTGGALTHVATASTASFPWFDTGAGVDLNIAIQRGRSYIVQIRGNAVCGPCPFDNFIPDRPAHDFMPGVGAGTLSWTFHQPPPNDHFAAATLLEGANPVDTSFATVEADEPGLVAPPWAVSSVWYRLSGGLGDLALHTGDQPAIRTPHQVSVYRGSSPSTLALVGRAATAGFPSAADGSQGIDLDVATGCESYYVQVVGRSPWVILNTPTWQPADVDIGRGELTREFQAKPLRNDAFVNAENLPVGRTVLPDRWWTCATTQPDEPAHGGAPAARSIWYRTTVASGRVTIDSPGNRVAVYQGPNLAALTRIADGSTGKASFLTPGGTYLVAVDGGSGTTVDLELTPGEVVTTPSGALTTDNEGQPPDGATASDPIETTLGGGAPGRRTIFETQGPTPPSAWTFLGWKVEIEAPPSTPTSIYTITFRIDGSLLVGVTGQLEVFRNGVVVPNCSPPPAPDPCVFSRTASAGDQIIIVRTSRASEWTFGTPRTTRGTALGLLIPSSGGDAEFLVASNGATVTGAFSYGRSSERFVATKVNALAIGGNKAWLAGVGRDGRTFLAYVEDNGPGSSDRFRLWIGGSERTDPEGRLRSGSIVIRP